MGVFTALDGLPRRFGDRQGGGGTRKDDNSWMMSLKPSPMQPIPELTERIAQSAFPRNDPVM